MAIGNQLEHFVLIQNPVAHLWSYSQNLIIQKGSVNFGYFEPTFDMLIKMNFAPNDNDTISRVNSGK